MMFHRFWKHIMNSLICSPPYHSVIMKEMQMRKPITSNSGWVKSNTDTHLTVFGFGNCFHHQKQWLIVTKLLYWEVTLSAAFTPPDKARQPHPLGSHWIWHRKVHLSTQPSTAILCLRVGINEDCLLYMFSRKIILKNWGFLIHP